MRVVVGIVELLVVGLALLVGGCSEPEPPRTYHRIGEKTSGPAPPDLPIVDCEDVDFESHPPDGLLRLRLRDINTTNCGNASICSRFEVQRAGEYLTTKLLRRLTGCSDCELIEELGVQLHRAVLYVRGTAHTERDYIPYMTVNDRDFPSSRYAELQIIGAAFTFRHRGPGNVRQHGRLDYICPFEKSDEYDEACLEFVPRPPGQTVQSSREPGPRPY